MPILDWHNRSQHIRAAAQAPFCALSAVRSPVGNASAQNILVHGDNLLALKALVPHYAGAVDCVFIDPPYNTRKDFPHYQDNLEHTQWLEMMFPRLVLLHELLADNGSIWVVIDDDEAHYLKVLMDEIFGRKNFVTGVAWQKFHSVKKNSRFNISQSHDYLLVYAKSGNLSDFNMLAMDEDALKVYKNPDNDPRGPWRTTPLTVSLMSGQRGAQYAKTGESSGLYEIVAPNGKRHLPTKGRCWFSKETIDQLIAEKRVWWGKDGNAVPMKKLFLSEGGGKKISSTFWPHTETGSNKKANEEMKNLGLSFSTAKPEQLLHRVLHLATRQGGLVLDSFLGSGTTAAVAHKMGRRWIGIEMGDHAETHCIPRLRTVVAGKDPGGVTEAAKWKGGGGFHFLRLGGPVFSDGGKINPAVKFPALAAHVWFAETRTPLSPKAGKGPFLGIHKGRGFALLYNGILGDKSAGGGNVLTRATLGICRKAGRAKGLPDSARMVIYGHSCRLREDSLRAANAVFKQTPYELKTR